MPGAHGVPACLVCQEHIDYNERLTEDLQIKEKRIRELERKLYRLEGVTTEKRGKSKQKDIDDAKEFLNLWDEFRRKHFPTSRKVIIDPEGSRGDRYRKARKLWSHEDLMLCLRGVELSSWHLKDRGHFEPKYFLAGDDQVEEHIQRVKDYERLREAGWDDTRARALIYSGVDKEAREEAAKAAAADICAGCGGKVCVCDHLFGHEIIRKAAA